VDHGERENSPPAKAVLTLGEHCEAFEAEYATYVGCRYAIAVANGTAALEIILRSLGVEGREVLVPTNTFAATAFAFDGCEAVHHLAGPLAADVWRSPSASLDLQLRGTVSVLEAALET